MANKKTRKLAASTIAATAAVAAIAPVAIAAEEASFPDVKKGDSHYEGIMALAEQGVIKGYADGTFGQWDNVTRQQVAVMLAKATGVEAPSDLAAALKDFNDVDADHGYAKEIAAVTNAGIFNGKANGDFDPYTDITRQQMASVLYLAFGLGDFDNGEDAKVNLDNVSASHKERVQTLANLGITVATDDFRPNEPITRGAFATMLYKAQQVFENAEPNVEDVKASNASTLVLSGSGLHNLEVEDITAEGNSIESLTSSRDGKTATVKLEDELIPDVATKVTVNEKEFEVTYTIEAVGVSIVKATYDDDIANQFVQIQVDGKNVTTQELINAGYDLKFEAYTSKAALSSQDVTEDLFKSETTGELATDLAEKFDIPAAGLTLHVKVTLTKGSEVMASELTEVTVKNLDLAADSVAGYEIINFGTDGVDGADDWTNDFVLNSNKLVTHETAGINYIVVKAGSEQDVVLTGYSIETSDEGVISVTDGVLKAEAPGKATITVSYGNASYKINLEVTNEERKPNKVNVSSGNVTLTQASSTGTWVTLLDQFGDPMPITDENVYIEQSNEDVAPATLGESSDESGVAWLAFAGGENGAGSNVVTFRDAAGAKLGSAAVKATVTDNDTLAKYSLSVDSSSSRGGAVATLLDAEVTNSDVSADATLDILSDNYVKINITGQNSKGVTVSDQEKDAEDYTVKVNQSRAGVLEELDTDLFVVKGNGFFVLKAGDTVGSATVTVTNADDNDIVATFKVTVEKVGYNVTGTTLKNVSAPSYATTLDYADFLNVTAAQNDPVVSGVKLTKDSAQPVRLVVTENEDAEIGTLYIDKNANGVYDANEIIVGSTEISTVGTIADAENYDNIVDGIEVVSGDSGSVLFKVLDNTGKVVASKTVKIDF